MRERFFAGGESTTREVEALMQQELVRGSVVLYEDVCRLTGCDLKTRRFWTVTNVWRRRCCRELGLEALAQDGAFHFMTSDELQDHSYRGVRKVGRATNRLVRTQRLVVIDELTGEDRKKRHFMLARESAALLEAVQVSRRRLVHPEGKTAQSSNVRLDS